LGMTKESLMRKVQELEAKVAVLTEENAALKLSLQNAIEANSRISESLSLTTNEHAKVRREKDDLTAQFRLLEERFDADKAKWDKELKELKALKAKLSDSSDATTTALQQEWEDMNAKRDLVRDELRRTREELLKEREELEAAQRKLLEKMERNRKTKQGLETIKKGLESSHAIAIPVLSKSVIQHATDMNTWIPILEAAREYKHIPVEFPPYSSVKDKDYDSQMKILNTLLIKQNKNFDKLLAERTIEATEIVSINAGKRKKREKTQQEIDGGYESLSESDEEVKPKQDMAGSKSKKASSSSSGKSGRK